MLGQHAGAILVLLALLTALLLWPSVHSFVCYAYSIGKQNDPCLGADPPPSCSRFARGCGALLQADKPPHDDRTP
jgi:hypothetical protein